MKNGVAATTKPFWNILDVSETEAVLTLYGEIRTSHPINFWTGEKSDGMFITPRAFLEDLERIKDKPTLTVRINSNGGDLSTGRAIYTQLKTLKAHKTCIIDSMCASAATLPAMACDVIKSPAGAQIMIHDPRVEPDGVMCKADFQRYIDMLESTSSAVAEIYAQRTKLDVQYVRQLMTAETWMNGNEAHEMGFVDEVMFQDVDIKMSSDRQSVLSNGIIMSVSAFGSRPNVPICDIQPTMAMNTKKDEEDLQMKTVDELRMAYPDLVNDIEQAAHLKGVTAERERMKAIDELQAAVPANLYNDAKYGDTICTAQELAFKAMTMAAQEGKGFQAKLAQDSSQSGVNSVVPAPNNAVPPGHVEEDAAAVSMIVSGTTKEGA